jgi:hypothetical protein
MQCSIQARFINGTTKEIVLYPGKSVVRTIKDAIKYSICYDNALVRFKFKGVVISARGDSDPEFLFDEWRRAKKHGIKAVGPSIEELIDDERKIFSDSMSKSLGLPPEQIYKNLAN